MRPSAPRWKKFAVRRLEPSGSLASISVATPSAPAIEASGVGEGAPAPQVLVHAADRSQARDLPSVRQDDDGLLGEERGQAVEVAAAHVREVALGQGGGIHGVLQFRRPQALGLAENSLARSISPVATAPTNPPSTGSTAPLM